MLTAAFVRNANAYSQLRFLPPWQRMRLKNTARMLSIGTAKRRDEFAYRQRVRRQGATQNSDRRRRTGAHRHILHGRGDSSTL